MNLLLDTHVWVWTQVEPDRIGPATRQKLEASLRLYVATISSLEIARLIRVGLLELDDPITQWIEASIEALQCSSIEMTHEVAIGAYRLPGEFHKDPADRILVAAAREHKLTLVTADERILEYEAVATLDARK